MSNDSADSILLLGSGGHCRSVLDVLLSNGAYSRIGIVDVANAEGSVFGIPFVGTDADLPALRESGYAFAFVAVGSVGNTSVRHKLAAALTTAGLCAANIVASSALVSKRAQLGRGIFIGHGAIVNAGAKIGDYAILNSGSIIEHDTTIGAFSHVSTGATVCGGVTVGEDAHIGTGSVVIQSVSIGSRAIIGAGSTVVRSIASSVVAYGNPCKERGRNENHNHR